MAQNKYFYQHLINHDDLVVHLDKVEVSDEQKTYLIEVVEKTVHLEVISLIMERLDGQLHEEFLVYLDEKPHDPGVLVFLKRSIEDIEDHIQRIVKGVKEDFIREIEDYKYTTREWLEGV